MPQSRQSSPQEAIMGVLELCDSPPAAVSLQATVADAVRMMLDRHVGAVAVVDSDKVVAGIFTERDVLRKLALSGRDLETIPVREVMTTSVELASADTTPGEALATMVDRHFRHLPIADRNGRLQGMLSIRDVLQWRVDDLTQELDSLAQYVASDGPGG
jgi:CBS domain-containing protein